jgi:aldose 1-epimerase
VMPAGLGFHPFFPRTGAASIAASARSVWLTDGEKLPRECVPVPRSWDLSAGRSLAELELDNCFVGWDGRASIQWPERENRLVLEGEWPMLSFLAVNHSNARDHFCVEPMSHCPDAINLARDGVGDTGVRVLAPGARRSATMILRPSGD